MMSTPIRSRGRPRGFDEAVVMQAILLQFWDKGYEDTSLDDLAAATGLKRGSLYRAFGSKQAMYLAAIDQFAATMRAGYAESFLDSGSIQEGLRRFYYQAIALYRSDDRARGCLIFCTAPAAANSDPIIAERLRQTIAGSEQAMTTQMAIASASGELDPRVDPAVVGQLAIAALHSLALRARANVPVEQLHVFVNGVVATLPWTSNTV